MRMNIQYLNERRSGLVEDVVLDLGGSVFALGWLALRKRRRRAGSEICYKYLPWIGVGWAGIKKYLSKIC